MSLNQRLLAVIELLAERCHKHAQGGFAVFHRIPPYALDDILMRQDLADILGKQTEQLVKLWEKGEFDVFYFSIFFEWPKKTEIPSEYQ